MHILSSPAFGYDNHFKKPEKKFGPFDIAILECGQYDPNRKYIHMMPNEMLQAAEDLKATKIIPVHWGKFKLTNHDWDAPITDLLIYNAEKNIPILTPMIGEKLRLFKEQVFSIWWEPAEK